MYSDVVLRGALNDNTHQATWIMQNFLICQKLKGQEQGEDLDYVTYFYFCVLMAKTIPE